MDEGDILEVWNRDAADMSGMLSVVEFDRVTVDSPGNSGVSYYEIVRGKNSDLPLKYTVPNGFTARIAPFGFGNIGSGRRNSSGVIVGKGNIGNSVTFRFGVNGDFFEFVRFGSGGSSDTFLAANQLTGINIFSENTEIEVDLCFPRPAADLSVYMTLFIEKNTPNA